ncbi:unnamed protein product [Pedinophyceae sp. YPF-701]|nr:unnamed protein product [Pedinophyceae sp. YPF-701]
MVSTRISNIGTSLTYVKGRHIAVSESLGLEISEVLEWSRWTPGAEHVKSITLKNVSFDVIKIKYGLPSTRYFQMDFPEPVRLSPGMTATIPVIFCPTKLVPYSDAVQFNTTNGSFAIQLEGTLPEMDLQMPSELDFGYTPCLEPSRRHLRVRNVGRAPVSIQWKVPEPFQIEPAEGNIQPDRELVFNVVFEPPDSSVFSAAAVCMIRGGPSMVTRLAGIGKYPYLRLERSVLDFREVPPGTAAAADLHLVNASVVPARFAISEAVGVPGQPQFEVAPDEGVVPAGGRLPLTVSFRPTFTTEQKVSATFHVQAQGGNRVELQLRGAAVGPKVAVNTSCLNFGDVAAGRRARRAFMLQNLSKVPVTFQVGADPRGLFQLDTPGGVLGPKASLLINVAFCPKHPSQYWRRLPVLVRDLVDPVSIDLIGTCHNDTWHPDPISEWHVDLALGRIAGPPREIFVASDMPKVFTEASGAFSPRRSGGTDGGGSVAAPLVVRDAWSSYFRTSVEADNGAMRVDTSVVDFGASSRLRAAPQRVVTVTNTAAQKLAVCWHCPAGAEERAPDAPPNPKALIAGGGAPPGPFQVFPEAADIPPGGSVQFRVQFRPQRDAAYYASTLECYCQVKQALVSSLVTGTAQPGQSLSLAMIPPPGVLTVRAVGHTFGQGRQESLPMISVGSPARVDFPAVYMGAVAHQVFPITNSGKTAVSYTVAVDRVSASAGVFAVTPEHGVADPDSTTLVAVRFHAKDARAYAGKVTVTFNGNKDAAQTVALAGAGYRPVLQMGEGGAVYLKPTCAGAVSHTRMTLRNPSQVPVAYAFQVPDAARGLVAVDEETGMVPPGQAVAVTWTFAPRRARTYALQVPCLLTAPHGAVDAETGAPLEESQVLSLVGEATSGGVQATPDRLDLGVVRIGHHAQGGVSLYNASPGVLQYMLRCSRVLPDGSEEPAPPEELIPSEVEGSLPGRVAKTVIFTLGPRAREMYTYRVRCYTSTGAAPGGGKHAAGKHAEPATVFEVLAEGQHPMLQVQDILASPLQKSAAWDLAEVQLINQHLALPLTPEELAMVESLAMGHATVQDVLGAVAPIPVGLPAGRAGGPASVVRLLLGNTSDLPVEWSASLPNETDIDMEHWVQPRYPPDELQAMEHLFALSPRNGKIAPGATQELTVRFEHEAAGLRRFPVLLTVANGKCVRLDLMGRTLPAGEKTLALGGEMRHELQPVELGCGAPPAQATILYNEGVEAVTYEIDTTPLAQLAAENHKFPVLELLSPAAGALPAGGHAVLWWSFTPIEEGTYVSELPVRVEGGEDALIVVTGSGVLPAAPRPPIDEVLEPARDLVTALRPDVVAEVAPDAVGFPAAGPPELSDPSLARIGGGADAAGAGARASYGGVMGRGEKQPLPARVEAVTALVEFSRITAPGQMLAVSQDVITSGPLAIGGVQTSILVLHNVSDVHVRYAWTLGDYAASAAAKGRDALSKRASSVDALSDRGGEEFSLFDGGVEVEPRGGTLKPGERCLCRVKVTAGARALVFDGYMKLVTKKEPHFTKQNAPGAPRLDHSLALSNTANLSPRQKRTLLRGPPKSGVLPLDVKLAGEPDGGGGAAAAQAGRAGGDDEDEEGQTLRVRLRGTVDATLPLARNVEREWQLIAGSYERGAAAGGGLDVGAGVSADELAAAVRAVLSDALADLALDPEVYCKALTQPEGGESGEEEEAAGDRARAAAEKQALLLEAEHFAAGVLEGAVASLLIESVIGAFPAGTGSARAP